MTLETDGLADAALRFSEAIRAERTSTFDALAAERQAALKIIEALRTERGRRVQEAGGRFVFGVALGVAAGVAAIYLVSQRANEEARLGIATPPLGGGDEGGPSLRDRFQQAVDAGRRAARGREDELWQLYRKRMAEGQQPPAKSDDFRY